MDDICIEWMRNKMYFGLGIMDFEVFDDLLFWEDGWYENEILKFLNEILKEGCMMIFYFKLKEEEEEIEVEVGKFRSFFFGVIFCYKKIIKGVLFYEGLVFW